MKRAESDLKEKSVSIVNGCTLLSNFLIFLLDSAALQPQSFTDAS